MFIIVIATSVNIVKFYFSDIMALSTMKSNIHSALCVPEERDTQNTLLEAKFNLMHTAYVTLISSASLTKGERTVHVLINRHFNKAMEV